MAPSKKSTPRKSKKAASNRTAGSASATISTASKRKKSKNHEEESEKGLKLLKRNCVAMKRISRSRSLKQKRVVQFNRTGTSYGKATTEMKSYIGVLARRKIPIVRTTWRTARKKVPGGVTAEEKEKIWERVQGAFVIGNESKRVVMQSAAARWREFKSRLTKVYIVPYLDKPEMLKYPPQDYKFINADNWTQFVTEQTKLAFLKLRKTQQARRRMNKYPHRLSRKGYVGLLAELKAKAEPEEASTITDEDELYDRCETWIAARVTKEGKFADEETQKKLEEIIELKEKVSTGETSLSGYNDVLEKALGKEHGGRVRGVAGFVNPTTYFHLPRRTSRQSIEETIKISLEKVLAEQTAKIIGETRKKTIEENNAFWAMKFETYKSQFVPVNGNGGQAGSSPVGLEKPIPPVSGQASCSNTADLFENDMHDQVQAPNAQAEIEEVIGKNIKGQVEVNGQVEGNDEPGVKSTLIFKCLEAMEVNKVAKKKTSNKRRRCEPKFTQPEELFGQEIAETDCKAAEEDVLLKTSDADTQIKRPKVTCEEVPVMLALGSLDNIVATGTSMKTDDPDELCHGYPLRDQNLRVSIEIAKQEYAKVPFPVGNDIKTVRQAMGSWIAWPDHLVIYTPVSPLEQPQKKREKRGVPVEIIDLKAYALNAPIQLKMLCMWGADELKNDKSLEFFIEPEVFGYTQKSWIFDSDLHIIASMTEITGNCIVAYQRYLYDVLKNTKMLDMIAFVDPAMVGESCGTVRSKAEHLCARFITSKPGQLFMVPYNSDQHWVLTVVEPEKEKVYYMDPLRRRLPIASAEWKSVINSAIAKYNTEKGRPSLNAVAWKNLGETRLLLLVFSQK